MPPSPDPRPRLIVSCIKCAESRRRVLTAEVSRGLNEVLDSSFGGFTAEQIRQIIEKITSDSLIGTKGPGSRSNSLYKFVRPLISCLIPDEALRGETVLTLLLWALQIDDKDLYPSVLSWTNCVVKFDLCPPKEITPLYEILLRRFIKSTSIETCSLFCELLERLTLRTHVKKWRISLLQREKNEKNPFIAKLLRRFYFLRPDFFAEEPASSSVYHRKKGSDSLNKRFEKLWKEKKRNYVLTDLFPDACLHWLIDEPVSKRRKLTALPESFSMFNSDSSQQKSLYDCRKMSELYDCFYDLALPDQTLSLLNSPQTFPLILLHKDSDIIQERFSISLYNVLSREFFIGDGRIVKNKENVTRKVNLLSKIHRLQEWFQEGVPVVTKFLAEYVTCVWNGQDFFLEVLRLISYVQITEYEELNDCLLSSLRSHFLKYDLGQRLVVLCYLCKLITHWIMTDYSRSKNSLKSVFPRTNCSDPLDSLQKMLVFYGQMVDLGFEPLSPMKRCYMHQTLLSYHTIMKCLLNKELPIKLDLPSSLCYFAAVDTTPVFISSVFKYILTSKSEMLPLCWRLSKENTDDHSLVSIAKQNAENNGFLNVITKDLLAIFSHAPVHLNRGQSIFKQAWDIEDEQYREALGVASHIAFLSYSFKFSQGFASTHKLELKDVLEEIMDPNSVVYENYLNYLEGFLPEITEFLRTFEVRKNKNASLSLRSMESITTSGVSSMEPSVEPNRKKNTNRKR